MAGIWLCVCALLSAAFFSSTAVLANENEDLFGLREIVDVNDSGVQGAAAFAVKEFNNLLAISSGLVTVEKAEIQAVAGLKYYLSVKISMNENDILPLTKICDFVVYYRPWLNEGVLSSYTCE